MLKYDNKFITLSFILMFFIQYLGVGFYAHILALLMLGVGLIQGRKLILSFTDWLFLFSIVIVFVIKLLGVSAYDNVLLFKFYWGFIIYYLLYKTIGFKLDFKLFFFLTCIVTTIDFVLINTIIPIGEMLNIPGGEMNVSASELSGLYHRCYGLASSPTASAIVVVALLAGISYYIPTQFRKRYILYAIPPLIMIGSGTGFLLFYGYLYFHFKLYKGFKLVVGIISIAILVSVSFYVADNMVDSLLSRLSSSYYDFIIDFKMGQIVDVIEKLSTPFQMLFGYNYDTGQGLRIMADFGWLDMLEAYGWIGLAVFGGYILVKQKYSNVVILILIVGAFHYPGMFSIPGQIIFAAALAYSRKNYEA